MRRAASALPHPSLNPAIVCPQLRPSATVYELAKNFNLEVSLFERLVKLDFPFVRLNYQVSAQAGSRCHRPAYRDSVSERASLRPASFLRINGPGSSVTPER